MSTPSTLTATTAIHSQHQRFLPSPADRYLPPPRPSSNLSGAYHQNIPTRPSSNLSNRQLPLPARPESGMSNGAYSHAHSQSRAAPEYVYVNGSAQQINYDDHQRTETASTQYHNRTLPPPQPQHIASASRASAAGAAAGAEMPNYSGSRGHRSGSAEHGRKRRQKSPVDWVNYFGGKPPTEIIEIHDDDSPAPPATIQRLPPQANGSSVSQHVDKKRRVNGGSGDIPQYSTTNTPYSYTNGASTDSLQATTAPTSLGSQASSGGGGGSVQASAQTGQKRKRTTRTSDADRKRQELARPGAPRGYLAEYGEYQTPPRQAKKQKDVVVPAIHEVRRDVVDRVMYHVLTGLAAGEAQRKG